MRHEELEPTVVFKAVIIAVLREQRARVVSPYNHNRPLAREIVVRRQVGATHAASRVFEPP